MKKLLQSEEILLFAACLYLYPLLGFSWWWFVACILLPDVGMLGYLLNPKAGAYSYNVLHHRGVAAVIGVIGYAIGFASLLFIGYIFFSHATMDRMFGYGLKYEEGFKFTHLGNLENR
jgi:hypothetical protein